MNKNIFDIKDISDLPVSVKEKVGVKTNTISTAVKNLLALFDIKDILSIHEMFVGYYRKYGIEVKRTWLSYALYNCVKRNQLIREPGVKKLYRKV